MKTAWHLLLSVSVKPRFKVLFDLISPDQPQQSIFDRVQKSICKAIIVQQVQSKLCPVQYEMSRKIVAK